MLSLLRQRLPPPQHLVRPPIAAQEEEDEEEIEVVRYTFWPKPPQTAFRDGRQCQQQYSRCKALPREGEPAKLAASSRDPLDEVDVRGLIAENMGWPIELPPPSRERLFAPCGSDAWQSPQVERVRVPIRSLPVSWRDVVYDAEVTQRGGRLRVLVSDLMTGW
mmetsp:Transcript_7009/g.12990  ORF Transcript_7009/g.12990 Transcript_7009/m.12990 type:complete len:163 (-) Transcript_7009:52-540(-)